MTKATPARRAALAALAQVRKRDAFVRDVLPGILDDGKLSAKDRAFATRLAIGCVQARGTLDEVLDRSMRKPTDVKPDVRDALRISAYELLFLGRDPYAAVDQGVELAACVAPRARGVANAVLRKAAMLADDFPFGDPEADIEAAARLHGFPAWLARDLEAWMGAGEARRFMQVSNEQPPVFAGINAIRATDAKAASRLEQAGIGFVPIGDVDAYAAGSEGRSEGCAASEQSPCDPVQSVMNDPMRAPTPGCIKLDDPADVADPAFRELIAGGQVIVADAAAQVVANVAAAHAGASLLDACAGRGTKALLIQSDAVRERNHQIERYVALDNVASKQGPLEEHARTCGAHVSASVVGDAADLDASLGDESFDEVLIDAPCTGLGTLRRHPEIRWKIAPADIDEAAELDARLLASGAAHVAPGGTLAYATCTVTPQENDRAIERFLASAAGAPFELIHADLPGAFATQLTSGGCDAHFCAVMRKRG